MRSPEEQEDFLERGRFGERKRLSRRSKTIIVIAILFAFATAASFRFYSIDEYSGGFALWNASEAYLFINVSDRGYHASLLQVPWILFRELVIGGFAAAEVPKDDVAYLVVIRVNSSVVERHVVKLADRANGGAGSDPSRFTPLEGRIYASCPLLIGQFMQDGHLVGNDVDDGLCWWAGDRFEKATPEERRRLDGIKRLTTADFDNDADGWSRRVFVAGPTGRELAVQVGGQFGLLVNEVGAKGKNGTVSIDIERPGKAAQRVAVFETYAGWLSSAAYRRAFRDPH